MKHVVPVPVAIGIAAGVVVGFCLGAMVTRHGEPAVVIRNATDATLYKINITTDVGGSYCIRTATQCVKLASVIAQTNGIERERDDGRGQTAFERKGLCCFARRRLCVSFI